MRTRAVRQTILALLVVTGFGAAYLTWDIFDRIKSGLAAEREVDRRLDRMSEATAALGAAQQAYVAPGQQRGDALTRASVMVQQIYDDIGALRLHARSSEAGRSLLAFGGAMDALVNIDDRAREHLRLEQELIAADLVYTEARQANDVMRTQLESLRDAETRFADTERRALWLGQAKVLGGTALVWLVVVLALVRVPAATHAAVPADAPSAGVQAVSNDGGNVTTIDLGAAAQVCTQLALLSGAAALPLVLARTARVLDAAGLVVWLGAGEELFPATSYGYGPRTLARLGPIRRGADNATAFAWRTGEMSIVPGSPGVNGAIVAPLPSESGCFGVLAAEVRHGREHDAATRAAAAIIAAQLATRVSPWPAPSDVDAGDSVDAAEIPTESGGPEAAEHTAASA